MKLIHTSDIRLDACFAASGMGSTFGNRRREGLRDVLETILTRAVQWHADALLVAGDLFELDRVRRDTVAFLQAAFEAVQPVPVFIAPGNRDPYVAGSPYADAAWPPNVVIFKHPEWEAHPVVEAQLVVHGFGFDAPHINDTPFGDLSIAGQPGWVQVGIANVPAENDTAAAAANGLDYLALGRAHAPTAIEGQSNTPTYYAGPPEGHGFDEPGKHHYLEVELREAGVQVTPICCSRVVYSTHKIDCSGFTTAHEAAAAIRALASDSEPAQVARVTLTGACRAELRDNLPAIIESASPAFDTLKLVDKTQSDQDYEQLAKENTCLGIFARTLNQEIADAPDENRLRFLTRARDLGVAAYSQRQVAIRGWEGD